MKTGKLTKTARSNFITYSIVIAFFLIIQIMSRTVGISSLIKGQLVPICAYIVMAVSLNLTVGVLGELSLGHAGFMSVGAFSGVVAAISLQSSVASDPLRLAVSMVIGAILAAIVGFIVGIPVLRLHGDYLAIVTLAFGEIIKSMVNNLYIGIDSGGLQFSLLSNKLLLAEDGRMILTGPMGLTGIKTISNFTAGFILIILCLFVIFNLTNSKSGRAIMALRDNRIAAESVGINVTKYKLMAFVISAAMAGAAGALFAMNYSTVVASKFDFNTSILVLVFVVLGGLGNMRGSIIAATLLTVLPELLRTFRNYRMLIYAIILILIMLVRNNPTLRQLLAVFKNAVKKLFTNLKTAIEKFFRKKGGDVNG